MTENEWTTVSVKREQKKRLKEKKPEGMAMGVFLVESVTGNSDSSENSVDTEALAQEISERISFEIETPSSQPVDAEAVADAIVENLGLSSPGSVNIDDEDSDISEELQQLQGRIDDLEATLPRKITDELRGQ